MELSTLESELLMWIAAGKDSRMEMLLRDFRQQSSTKIGHRIQEHQVMIANSNLIRFGYAYISFTQSSIGNCALCPTELGREAAKSGEWDPFRAEEYLRRLDDRVPSMNATVRAYLQDSLLSFRANCYLASAVMVGVASEAAFLELAESFISWLPSDERGTLTSLNNEKSSHFGRFKEFRDRIRQKRNQIPPDLAANMDLLFDGVLDLIRVRRNESGHPSGKLIDRGEIDSILRLFARYIERLYSLKAFFDRSQATP